MALTLDLSLAGLGFHNLSLSVPPEFPLPSEQVTAPEAREPESVQLWGPRVAEARAHHWEQPVYRTTIERPPPDADPGASPHAHGPQHAWRQRTGTAISARFCVPQRASAPAVQDPGPTRQ
jgi:hypothetical protein